jgi:hypothetical protein
VILLSLLLAVAPASPIAADEVIARVDGVQITRSAYQARVGEFLARKLQPTPDQVVQNLVEEALLAAEAEKLGLRKDPAVAAQLERERRRIMNDAFLETELTAAIDPPDTLLRQMFHATGDFVRLQVLSYQTSEEADAAAKRLRGGAALLAEAKTALTSRVAPRDADAPLSMRAELDPAVADLLFKARAGDLVGPYPLSAGFALAKVVEIIIGTDAEFQARRSGIADHARKQLATQGRVHYLGQLKTRAGVKLDEAFLAGTKGIDPTPAEAAHVIATIDGKPLRYGDILPGVRALASVAGSHGMGTGVKIRVANQEIEARLVAVAAEARGCGRRPEVLVTMSAAERGVIANQRLEALRRGAPPPTDAEVKSFYDRNRAAYGNRPLDAVRSDAAARAAAMKAEQAVVAHLERLRKQASISVNGAAVARVVKAP